jgi:xylulokinase
MTYVIGIDSSTTATKAVVWDREGRSVAEGRATFDLTSPRPAFHEQDPEDWWRSTRDAIRGALRTVEASEIDAIGLTHQRETFACLDEDGSALRPAILWMDSRASKQVREKGSEDIHRLTGKPPDTTPAFYKLLWLNEHEPDTVKRASKVVDVHTYLVQKLTGEWKTTVPCADPLGLVDLEKGEWSDQLLDIVGVTREQLPELFPAGAQLGELSSEAAKEVGLKAGLPIVGGAGDGQSAGLGANITKPGRAYLNLGTAVVAGTTSDAYRYDTSFRTMGSPMPGKYTFETLIQGGVLSISWFLERVAKVEAHRLALDLEDVDLLEASAVKVGLGADGLLFVPYLAGSQTPYWNSSARGMMFGLGDHHGRGHFFRAIEEGIAFEQRVQLEGLDESLDAPVDTFFTMGGGSRSPLWRQIVADVTKRNVVACKEVETTCLGAGMHAAAAVGWYGSIEEAAEAMSGEGARHEPDDRAAAAYDKLFEVYKELYPRTSELHQRLQDALEH